MALTVLLPKLDILCIANTGNRKKREDKDKSAMPTLFSIAFQIKPRLKNNLCATYPFIQAKHLLIRCSKKVVSHASSITLAIIIKI